MDTSCQIYPGQHPILTIKCSRLFLTTLCAMSPSRHTWHPSQNGQSTTLRTKTFRSINGKYIHAKWYHGQSSRSGTKQANTCRILKSTWPRSSWMQNVMCFHGYALTALCAIYRPTTSWHQEITQICDKTSKLL